MYGYLTEYLRSHYCVGYYQSDQFFLLLLGDRAVPSPKLSSWSKVIPNLAPSTHQLLGYPLKDSGYTFLEYGLPITESSPTPLTAHRNRTPPSFTTHLANKYTGHIREKWKLDLSRKFNAACSLLPACNKASVEGFTYCLIFLSVSIYGFKRLCIPSLPCSIFPLIWIWSTSRCVVCYIFGLLHIP